MKIAIFVETYLPYINGVVTHVTTLKEGLEKEGHEVLVVTAKPGIHKYRLENNILYCPGVRLKRIYGFAAAMPMSFKRLSIIKKFSPDIIHIHQEFGVGFFALRAAQRLRTPLVYTLHTMYDDYLYYVVPKGFVRSAAKIFHRYLKFFTNRADAITGPSRKVSEYLKVFGVKKEVYVVPNAVETDVFSPEKIDKNIALDIRKKYKISKDKTVAVFVGRLGKEKNVETMLEFFAKNVKKEDNLHLLIIGNGPYKTNLEKISKSLNISDMVTFTGEVKHMDLPPFYAASDLYITTSLSDTNSISMLEAMAMGLPTLHIKDELNHGQVVHNENGYVFENADEMYFYLKKYRDLDAGEKQRLIWRTRKMVEEKGSIALANKMLQIYNHVLDKKKSDK